MKYDTIKDAAHAWVREMNVFQTGMIQKIAEVDHWSTFYEITPITVNDRVWSNEHQEMGTVINIFENENGDRIAKVEMDYGFDLDDDSDGCVEIDATTLKAEYDGYLPMWGWMWQFGDSVDDWWLENNLEAMADCGFRIYEHDEFGYFFGIDGAGYNFYESHWIPLYKKRGLRWHKGTEEESEE